MFSPQQLFGLGATLSAAALLSIAAPLAPEANAQSKGPAGVTSGNSPNGGSDTVFGVPYFDQGIPTTIFLEAILDGQSISSQTFESFDSLFVALDEQLDNAPESEEFVVQEGDETVTVSGLSSETPVVPEPQEPPQLVPQAPAPTQAPPPVRGMW